MPVGRRSLTGGIGVLSSLVCIATTVVGGGSGIVTSAAAAPTCGSTELTRRGPCSLAAVVSRFLSRDFGAVSDNCSVPAATRSLNSVLEVSPVRAKEPVF